MNHGLGRGSIAAIPVKLFGSAMQLWMEMLARTERKGQLVGELLA